MGYVGGYILDLYCDGPNCTDSWRNTPDNVGFEETFQASVKVARKVGWFVNKNGKGRECGFVLCPRCNTKENRKLGL